MNHNKQIPKIFCTTREAANLLAVSMRTAQLWVESGLLEAWKTEGGHRRISRQSVDRLLANPIAVNLMSPIDPFQNTNAAKLEPAQDNLNILVVEDDPTLRRLYEIKLKNWNMPINVKIAGDGYEAMILIGYIKPDLMILDLQLPGLDGFRMMNTIKSMSEFKTMDIVVVSGLDASEITSRGGIPNDISILPKPIPFDRLQAIAEQMMFERQINTKNEYEKNSDCR